MERVRAFIALNLPIATASRITEVQRSLRSGAISAGAKISWVRPENLHLTLKFLGEIPIELAWAIKDVLRDKLESHSAAIGLRFGELKVFDDGTGHPRVLWLGVDPDGERLANLVTAMNGWLAELGIAEDERPFIPHITLGRIRQSTAPFWQEIDTAHVQACTAKELALYRSDAAQNGVNTKPGRTYTALMYYLLQVEGRRHTNPGEDSLRSQNNNAVGSNGPEE